MQSTREQKQEMMRFFPYKCRVRVREGIWKGKKGTVVGYMDRICQPLVELDGINDKTVFEEDWKTISPTPFSEMPPMRFKQQALEVIDEG